jgi:methylmalonyl-CoA mutase N-terminal domain/subunit
MTLKREPCHKFVERFKDILKEDQAQNTCIFSTEFALRLMGDVQEYFIKNKELLFGFNIRVSYC